MHLSDQLAALNTHKEDFDDHYQSFLEELEQEDPKVPKSLQEFHDWINDVLDSLNNHGKLLELSLNQMQSKFMPGHDFLDGFQADLKLPDELDAKIALGFAKIDRLTKYPIDLSQ